MGGVMTTFVGVLGLRMWQLGVRDADQYYLLAEENRISLRLVPPNRGRIYDRAGKLVADNEQAFRVTLVREDWVVPEELPFGETVIKPLRGGETLRWRMR